MSAKAADFHAMNAGALYRALADGRAVEGDALAGFRFKGTSLGLPRVVVAATWRTFRKAMVGEGAAVRGWNVRIDQTTGRPMERGGRQWSFGHYRVHPISDYRIPMPRGRRAPSHGVMLDYGHAGNHPLDPTRAMRDVLVATDDPDLFLGWMYVEFGLLRAPTPSFFTLEREGEVEVVESVPRRQ